jgi:uncharacterized SAM-binding protein YcdF (DUF218 family)
MAIPPTRMPVPPSHDNRGHHRRRGRHDRRWRRSRSRCGCRAGSQCESRNESGRAERPASRDKTHVSPPRVESDTLYQPDTQSRAAQDEDIIASSRLFSMGNLTLNHLMLTILIFGAAIRPDGQPSTTLRRRVEAALAAARGHETARFIPTGAIGRFGPSEASVMARLLMDSGVRHDRILLEETGCDTLSSARAIYHLLREQRPLGPVMVATSQYHQPRCLTLLCLFGIEARPCPWPQGPDATSWWERWYWRLREVPALPYDAALALWSRLRGTL